MADRPFVPLAPAVPPGRGVPPIPPPVRPGAWPVPPRRSSSWRGVLSDPRDARLRSVLGTIGASLVAAFSSMVAVAFAGNAAVAGGRSEVMAILGIFAGIAGGVALVWRARYPIEVCLGTAVLALVFPLDAFAPLLALTWVIARRMRSAAVACAVAAALATGLSLWRDAMRDGDDVIFSSADEAGHRTYLAPWGYVMLGVLLVAVAVAAGLARRYAERARSEAGAALQHAQVAAELRTELSRQEERDLIAREMHDTVAHHLSLVSLQAAALEATADDPSSDVPAAARSMRDNAHQALEEMRALVASLRDATTATEPGPAPQLAELPRLVDQARAAGANVSATLFVSDQDEAPAALTRAVYRIVQESLTNALKHAPGAPVEIDVRAGRGPGVDVVVRNRHTAVASGVPGGGAGLRGMAERAGALGGTFEAGPAGGWFVVRAHLPWSVTPPAAGVRAGGVGGRF